MYQYAKEPDLNLVFNADWMHHLESKLINKPLIRLILPGTHDSAAYKLDHTINLFKWNSWFRIANVLALIFPFLAVFLKQWAVTQKQDLYGQLQAGIRFFDLRVSVDDEGELILSHTFACITLTEALDQIQNFMVEHPKEVLVINIKPDLEHRDNFTSLCGDNMLKLFQRKLGIYLFDQSKNDDPAVTPYQKMISTNRRILLNSECPFLKPDTENTREYTHHNYTGQIEGNWLNTTNHETAIKKLRSIQDKYIKAVEHHKLNELSYTLTPDAVVIQQSALYYFMGLKKPKVGLGSLQEMAETLNKDVSKTLTASAKEVNIVSMDFPENSDAITTIINKNRAC